MNPRACRRLLKNVLAASAQLALMQHAVAVNIQDDLTQSSASLAWIPINGACMTAGSSTAISSSNPVPACVGLPYYAGDPNALNGGSTGTLPDVAGKGALRFTDWFSQNGAVISGFTFPANQGVSATFTTVTYQGDSGGSGKDGADGISFFLLDGSQPAPSNVGSWGGSLGYTCSNVNTPYIGMVNAYVGLGIDEYGNFLNQGDNTATGKNYVPNRIGMRGAGNVAWSWLNTNYPDYYPNGLSSTTQNQAVQNTCKTGTLWNYGSGSGSNTGKTSVGGGPPLLDYALIPNANTVLSGLKIANESAVTRLQGTPITYNLQITSDGLLSLQYKLNGGTYQPVLTRQSITNANGALPTSLRFGFAGSTGGSRNIHEITCFQATPADQSDSSAGVNTQQAAQVRIGTQVYLAFFHPSNWWGQLTSQYLVTGLGGAVSISNTVNWDASCVLTGGTCASTGVTGMSAEAPASRTILSYDPAAATGIPFEWSSLNSSQQAALTAGDASATANRLNFLRGDRSNEITTSGSGLYRTRTSVLGDLWHSNPTWVGPPSAPYSATWADQLNPGATMPENASTAQTYTAFASSLMTRMNVVYAGANDGLLHGFRSGHYDGNNSSGAPYGNFVANSSYPNDGQELLAYMPAAVVQTIHNASTSTSDYSSSLYAHAFSVDATPGTGDLFYKGAWHTWLVSGLGGGGNSVFALDITDPSAFSEANAATLVLREYSPSNLPCYASGCGNNLGNTYGTPTIRRFHNGMWGVVFGNGYGSSSGHAGVYVVTIDPATAVPTAYYLDAGADPSGAGRADGIAYASPADLDGDHVVDYIYAGDQLGNIWRFDVTSSNPANWAVSNFGGTSAKPLFTTPAVAGGSQQINTKVQMLIVPSSTGAARAIVVAGTGQEIPPTVNGAISYAGGQQAVYGIWDWNMSAWNTLNPSAALAALSGTSAPGPLSYSSGSGSPTLASQTISLISAGSGSTLATRTISANNVCWAGTSGCTGKQYGWVVNLPAAGEQVIYNPTIYNGAVIINTTVPPNNSPFACSSTLATGWTMAFAPGTGGAFTQSFFPNNTGAFTQVAMPASGALVSIMGTALNATGTGNVVANNNNSYLVNQTTSGVGNVTRINPPKNTTTKRLNWTQLR
ncbi:MAG: pilus assembly protein PilY [Pseudomonadota bacterium]|nr:pilus assembly protein PilY [Pseudomonadota bacterium]